MNNRKSLLAVAVAATVFTLSVSALEKTNAEGSKNEEVKTVAWYVANIKEAKAKNKECFANPGNKELQATANCVNSLQALKMSFALSN
jgi:hypothetical protein